jgi:hypothetical protein
MAMLVCLIICNIQSIISPIPMHPYACASHMHYPTPPQPPTPSPIRPHQFLNHQMYRCMQHTPHMHAAHITFERCTIFSDDQAARHTSPSHPVTHAPTLLPPQHARCCYMSYVMLQHRHRECAGNRNTGRSSSEHTCVTPLCSNCGIPVYANGKYSKSSRQHSTAGAPAFHPPLFTCSYPHLTSTAACPYLPAHPSLFVTSPHHPTCCDTVLRPVLF